MFMKSACLLLMMTAVSAAESSLTLENDHIQVTFQRGEHGPELVRAANPANGLVCEFTETQAFAVFMISHEQAHDPSLAVEFTEAKSLAFQDAQVSDDAASLQARYRLAPWADFVVTYTLDADQPLLRKSIRCVASPEQGSYLAGVRLWQLTSDGMDVLSHGEGRPVVLTDGADGGCMFTLEWPRSNADVNDSHVQMSYAPCFSFAPAQAMEVAAGSLLFFTKTANVTMLESARHAFFDHVRDRVQPMVPAPIKFTTWGPWMREARTDRSLEIMDDLEYIGCDIFHFDAGWQWPEEPYTKGLDGLINASDRDWDLGVTQPMRLPNGMFELLDAVKAHGMELSLWFDACGHVFVRETEQWAVRDKEGKAVHRRTWENPNGGQNPAQSLASRYADRARAFTLECLERFDLGGVMFDNNNFQVDYATDHDGLANGWGSLDLQLRRIMEIFDASNRRRPGIYRFFCAAHSWPWAMLHVTHIHAGDPGMSGKMQEAIATDYSTRALAFERRLAWQRHYNNFVPPWGVKGDVAGWGLQQFSPIAVNLADHDEMIGVGEGWTQNMFTCFATTSIRDIRFDFEQMPLYERDILKEWIAWDRTRTKHIFNCQPLTPMPEKPNEGLTGFSHVGNGQGVMYLFNTSFGHETMAVKLDETAGFAPQDEDIPVYMVYPVKARLGESTLSYGDTLSIPIAPKDCVVLEVGLGAPADPAEYESYVSTLKRVERSYDAVFDSSLQDIVAAVADGQLYADVGYTARDKRIARSVLETVGAAIGKRLTLEGCTTMSPDAASARLVIGTHEGLAGHPEFGDVFREMWYSRYLAWGDRLISAPLVAKWDSATSVPTYCLIAPRPEQLARLAVNLAAVVVGETEWQDAGKVDDRFSEQTVVLQVPAKHPVLRFRPLQRQVGALTAPSHLSHVIYEVYAEADGQRTLIWREDVPPLVTLTGASAWWQDRVVAIPELAGQSVEFQFTAAHLESGDVAGPHTKGGFDRVGVASFSR